MTDDRKLRIAYVTDVYDGVKTGGVLSAQRFVEALRERHSVTVVSTGEPEPGRVVLPRFALPLRVMREMGFAFAVPRRRILEAVFREVDVVHIQFPFWLGIRAAMIARRLGKPVIAALHVQPENMFYNVGLRWPALCAWTYRLLVRLLFNRADAVVCPSRFGLQELRAHRLTAPAFVVSNGIAPWLIAHEPMERLPRHRGKFLVISVGRLGREKRVDVIIEGVRRSQHRERIQLVVTGRGPEEGRVRRLAASLPVAAEVTFVNDDELRRLMNTADLMVHASEVELEGMAVLEALGCGTPALVADAPLSAARQFAVSSDFLFAPNDPDDLARHLDHIIDTPACLEAARQQCRRTASSFSFEESVRRMEELYRRVAGKSLRPAAPRASERLPASPGAQSTATLVAP
jgi:1,2-diacylglycerol 3-alpha-glucosyltransferase